MNTNDEQFMQRALELARQAEAAGEVPVGAVIVKGGEIVGEGFNQPIRLHDPSAHAEMLALRAAAQRLENYRLSGCVLYVTLEPCAMCMGAMVHARISRLVYATADPRTGSAGSIMDLARHPALNHQLDVTSGILETECAEQLRAFFRSRR